MEKEKSLNTYSIIAFVLSFLIFPVGLILSIIGLAKCKKYEKEEGVKCKSKIYNIIGIIVSCISIFITTFIILIVILTVGLVTSKDSTVLDSYTCNDRYNRNPAISANFKNGRFTWGKYNDTKNNVIEGTYDITSRQINNSTYTYKLTLRPDNYRISNNMSINTNKTYDITIVKKGYNVTISFENGTTYNCYSSGSENEF